MTTIIEAIYEHGVLKPQDTSGLKEQHRYRVILQEIVEPEPPADPELAAELERRTTILPDGRRIVRLMGLFDRGEPGPSYEEIESALDEYRQEQAKEWDELYGPEQA
jgi:predicted DNA-binding antitoxin AbrB/MazE fold protein